MLPTCMAGVNPRPARMTDALEGALSDSITSSSAYTSARRVDAVAGAVLQKREENKESLEDKSSDFLKLQASCFVKAGL